MPRAGVCAESYRSQACQADRKELRPRFFMLSRRHGRVRAKAVRSASKSPATGPCNFQIRRGRALQFPATNQRKNQAKGSFVRCGRNSTHSIAERLPYDPFVAGRPRLPRSSVHERTAVGVVSVFYKTESLRPERSESNDSNEICEREYPFPVFLFPPPAFCSHPSCPFVAGQAAKRFDPGVDFVFNIRRFSDGRYMMMAVVRG